MTKQGHILRRRRSIFVFLSALVLLTIGGTIAFNNNISTMNNKFGLAYYQTENTEKFTSPDDWKTCDEVPKEAIATNKSTMDIKVRVGYIEYWRNHDDTDNLPLVRDNTRLAVINFQNANDWEDGNDGWYYWKGTLAPGESTNSYFKSVTYNCEANMSLDVVCTKTATGTECVNPENPYDGAKYHLDITIQTSQEDGEFPEPATYAVSIDPSGGNYNGSSELYTTRVRAGTVIDLSDISYVDHEFNGWTRNGSSAFAGQTITITEDTTLVANWLSSIFHTVTVNPNGGIYDDKSTASTYDVREGTSYAILDTNRENYAFEGWEYADGTPVTGDSLDNITSDIVINATWAPAVARIERTGKLYSSIMKAEAAAQTNDIITLLVDTEETVTNEKTVTLNLNGHTVTGSLTNTTAGNLTLIDGEINNPDGTALTNNGTLTMGINDYKADGKVNIINNYVRLIGTHTSLKQNGVFNFYDGFLEGDVGLEGPYNDSPVYRNIEDGTVVHYFPLVDHIGNTERQHVELASADLAVSKTTVGGDIYYYNLQDNINTSARTGYKIYIVRDFPASYPIISRPGTSADIDLVGYTVSSGEDITVDGELNITDSGSEADPSVKGKMTVRQTITVGNTGELNIDNAEIQEITSNTLLQNYGTVNLTNGAVLSSTNGYVMVLTDENNFVNMDATSMITSSTPSKATIRNERTPDNPFVLSGGIIHASTRYAIENKEYSDATFRMTGGEVRATNNATSAIYQGKVVIDGGKVNFDTATSSGTAIANTWALTINDGEIIAHNTNAVYAVGGCDSTVYMNGGSIEVTSDNGAAYGIRCAATVRDATITATAPRSSAVGIGEAAFDVARTTITTNAGYSATGLAGSGFGRNAFVSDTMISSTSSITNTPYYGAFGIDMGSAYVEVSGDTVITAHNTSGGISYGIRANGYGGGAGVDLSSGTISSTSDNGNGIGVEAQNANIMGGSIYGNGIGINSVYNILKIGKNDNAINITSPRIEGGDHGLDGAGGFDYYDGVLIGGTNSYVEGVIRGTPDGTNYHQERAQAEGDDPTDPEHFTGTQSTWLVEGEKYLAVGDREFSSLTAAYQAAGDGGTVKVIKDVSIAADLPVNPSGTTINFDLNGHTIHYAKGLPNEGIMNILDSSSNHSGVLNDSSSGFSTISNSGTLTIKSGTIQNSVKYAIDNSDNATLIIDGGEIKTTAGATRAIYRGKTTMNAGKITIDSTYDGVAAFEASNTLTINDGTISVHSTNAAYGIIGCHNAITVSNASLSIDSDNSVAYGIRCSATVSDSTITVDAPRSDAVGLLEAAFDVDRTTITANAGRSAIGISGTGFGKNIFFDDSTITVTSSTSNSPYYGAYGIYTGSAYAEVNSGTITATNTNNGFAYGINANGYGGGAGVDLAGGTISATTGYSDGGIGIAAQNANITGGSIYGSYLGVSATSNMITIGNNTDNNIDIAIPRIEGDKHGLDGSGGFNYYDGILIGGDSSYVEGVIRAIPEGTTYHKERAQAEGDDPTDPDHYTGTQSTWLVEGEKYLAVGAQEFNSLTAAYQAVADGGTVKVIKDILVAADLPTNPAGKTIYFDLNGHSLSYTKPLPNAGTMNIVDSSADQTGVITNPNRSYVIDSSGTLNVQSGTILSSTYRAIKVSSAAATVNLTGGEVRLTGNADFGVYYDANSSQTGSIRLNGGKVTMENITNGATALSGRAFVESGTITGSGSGEIRGIAECRYNDKATITGGTITLRSTSIVRGSYCPTTMSGGTIDVKSTEYDSYGISGYATMSGGTIISEAKNVARGIAGSVNISGTSSITVEAENNTAFGFEAGNSDNVISGGTITVHSKNGDAYAAHQDGFYVNGRIDMSGGTLTATSDNASSTGLLAKHGDITGGTITGGTIGIQSVFEKMYIGTKNTPIDINTPIIRGGSYGLAGVAFDFYDGTLKGGVYAYQDGVIKTIADDSTVHIGSETIDGDPYNVQYLIAEYDVARINSTNYTSLAKAITAAQTGDTIVLIDDNYIFYPLNIPSDKDITIETDGYDVIESNPITNNGKVVLKNSNTSNNPLFDYSGAGYFIQNKAGAELEIINIPLESKFIIENSGSLSLNNVSATSTDTAIKNLGTLEISNHSAINGTNYAIYSSGVSLDIADSTASSSNTSFYQSNTSDSTIDNSTLTGYFSNQAGKLDVTSSTVQRSGEEIRNLIANGSTANTTFDDSTITFSHDTLTCYQCNGTTIAIDNSGELTLKDSTATQLYYGFNSDINYLVRTTGGKLTVDGSTLLSDQSNNTGNANLAHYGIHSANSIVNITDSDITVEKAKGYGVMNDNGTVFIDTTDISINSTESYGIYNNTGEVTLGEAEPTDSGNWGKATASVSTTDPNIKAVGTSNFGIGVKNISGRFNYYDGRITGSTQAMPETPTNVEYKYEPRFDTDGDGYQYCILIWLPGGE